MQVINLRSFKKRSLQNQKRYRYFLTKTENNPPKELDAMADVIDKEVWAETACLSCANCCKVMTPTYTFKDLKRISTHLGMSVKAFKEKWLYFDKKAKDWKNVSTPCQFLNIKTNKCNVYEVRPTDCAGFPHLNKKKMTDYMHIHRQNLEYCPATLKMVEKLKERILLSKPGLKAISMETI